MIRLARPGEAPRAEPEPQVPASAPTTPPVAAPVRTRSRLRAVRRLIVPAIIFVILAAIIVLGVMQITPVRLPFGGGVTTRPVTESLDVVAAIGKLILLPDETPTVATVTDLAPLKDQAFFVNAALGDVVLMFPQAGKAILYRPGKDLIIEAAPLTLTE